MTTKTDEQERADFEAWYMEQYPTADKPVMLDGEYMFLGDSKLFAGFRAGRRAALQDQDREDAEVMAYALPGGISVEHSMQRDGTYLWAVRDGFKQCLSKSGEWDYEPFPSSRTDEWLDQHRFSSAGEAIDHARRRIEGDGE